MMRTHFRPILLARILKNEHPKTMIPKVSELAPLTRYGSCWPPAPVSANVSDLFEIDLGDSHTVEGIPDSWLSERNQSNDNDVEQRTSIPACEARHGL